MKQQVSNVCNICYVINPPQLNSCADSRDFIQSVENLTFFDGTSNMITKQCYNLTLVNDIQCEYFTNCTSVYLLSQLTTDSNTVKLENSEVYIYIEEDLTQCGMLVLLQFFIVILFYCCLLIFPQENTKDCTTSESTTRSEQSSSNTAVVAILSATLVIVLMAVIIVIVLCFLKEKKVTDTDLTQ